MSAIPDFLYGTAWKEDRTAALTELAVRSGFRAIDTANQRKHYVEAAAGEGLAAIYRAGIARREDIFLQTKFTSLDGQDHRLPYDPDADLTTQVAQSMSSSLEHLATDYVDSYVMHGPDSGYGWNEADVEVWAAMRKERDAGRTRLIGVANVSLRHLMQMEATGEEMPRFVQNRCLARAGWDRAVRQFCTPRGIVYQGFWLLTGNMAVLAHPLVTQIAAREQATPAQVIFKFVRALGMLPLTGTSNETHMRQDLDCSRVQMSAEEVQMLETPLTEP